MKSIRLNLHLTDVIVILAVGVLLPVLLATTVGIVALVLAKDAGGIVTGVLVISFAVTALGSALVTVVLTGRKARLARRQADFVANISHELRTPLSAIKLYAQTLQSGKLADDPRQTAQSLATILREAERLDVMIDGALTWRASSGDMIKIEKESQPVSQAVNDAIERFQAMVAPGEVAFSFSNTSRLCVRHDVRALHIVLLNLLTNAYKYTGKDKRISLRVRDEEAQVLIEVKDNGMGLTAAEIKHIFQPFYRATSRGEGDAGGVGLGLAIVQYLVHQHKGAISVDSEPGKGSTFIVRLPAENEKA